MDSGVDFKCSGPYDVFVVYLSLMNVPQEIFDEWEVEWWETVEPGGECDGYEFFANEAAEWAYKKGADDELDACLAWFKNFYKGESWMLKDLKRFREARRKPKDTIKLTVNGIPYPLTEEQQEQLNQIINSNA